jgi:hypothetical protein
MTMYLLSHTHRGINCPGKDPEMMKELATKFSKENLAKKNVKILDVFVDQSCMLPQPGAVRPGYQEIRAKYYIKSKASRSQLEQVRKMAEDLSPTRDSLRAVRFSSELIIEN